ncbi:MAG: hypothetical protein NTU79_24850 [Planctomycetota bacterium]|nr:hypothetical protein [Planctomycetota bacterium]
MSKDPIGFDAGDANLYRYVGNGPTNGSDPSGLIDDEAQLLLEELLLQLAETQQMYSNHVSDLNRINLGYQAGLTSFEASGFTNSELYVLGGVRAHANLKIAVRNETQRLKEEAYQKPFDDAYAKENPRLSYVLRADGSTGLVSSNMDETVRQQLEGTIVASTRAPRRYGVPGENLGQVLSAGTSAIPLRDSDLADIRQERLSQEAEIRLSRDIIIGSATIGIAGPEELLVGVFGRLAFGEKMLHTVETVGDMIPLERLDPRGIRFSQDTVSPFFSTGGHLDDAVNALRRNPSAVDNFPIIRVVEHNSKLYSLDNRRLAVFTAAQVDSVPVQRLYLSDPAVQAEFLKKFKPINDGNMIIVVPKAERAAARKILREFGRYDSN